MNRFGGKKRRNGIVFRMNKYTNIITDTPYISASKCGPSPTKLLIFIVLVSLFLFSSQILAKEQALDVAIIMDTSGSMSKNDPVKLRREAAKMFVELLDRKDRVSLVSFSGRAYPITRFLSLNERKNEQKLLKSIDKLIANGKYTNLHDALLRGYELLTSKNKKGHAKHIILMSDGKMDLGNEERNLRLLEKTLAELTPKLASKNIKVHTVAFTKKAYIPLLKLAADDTDGQFVLLNTPQGIHQVFETLFERTKLPEMLPLREDSFVLDNAVKEITIVASKFKPHSNITLASPDGLDISKANHDETVKWFSAKQFDLITIKKPSKGYWLIKYSEGGNKAYIISDFKLEATSTKKHAEPGSPLQIQAYLSKNNKKINRRAILRSTEFKAKVTSPIGSVINNLLLDDGSEIGSERKDGIYGISYAFELEGTYKVEITATGQTFDRKKTLFIDVASTNPNLPFAKAKAEREKLAELKKQAEMEAARLAKEEAERLRDEAEALEAEKIAIAEAEKNKHGVVNNTHDKVEEESIHEDEHAAPHADPHTEETAEHDENTTVEEPNSNGFTLGNAVFIFIMFNVFLGTMGGGYYFYHRRKQKQKSKDIENPNNELEETATEKQPKNTVDLSSSNEPSEFGHMDDDHEDIDLDADESISSAVTDIDLEEELSSILEDAEQENEK